MSGTEMAKQACRGLGNGKLIDDLKGIQPAWGWSKSDWERGMARANRLLLTDFTVKARSHGVVAQGFENQSSLLLSLLFI